MHPDHHYRILGTMKPSLLYSLVAILASMAVVVHADDQCAGKEGQDCFPH